MFAVFKAETAAFSAPPSMLKHKFEVALTLGGFGIIFAATPASLSAFVAIIVSALLEKNRMTSATVSLLRTAVHEFIQARSNVGQLVDPLDGLL